MPVENKELTLQEARLRAAGGGDILVSPRGLETNREFLKMRKISDLFNGCDMDALHMFFQGLDAKGVYHDLLYSKFVGSSLEVCEADVIKVVSSCLDYYVKATIQQDEMKYTQLVGNNLPFASTSGNNITYFKLLHYMDMHPTPSEEVTLARELVSAAENRLLMDFGINPRDPDTPALALRASLRIFNRSLLRKERVTSAHLISEILFTDCNSPLCQQDLSQKLHAVKDNIWNMENPRHLYKTGLRVIVLEHLQQKYETEGLREGYLIYHLGFNAMKYFLQKMVPYSMTFHFGELHGTIKKDGEDVSLYQNHDLIALRRSLASP